MSERRTLLIVEDDAAFRDRLARAMRDRGFEVIAAADYAAAIAAARDESPEFALVDLRLPGESGLTVVRDLKTLDPATIVVVLTGYGSIAITLDGGGLHWGYRGLSAPLAHRQQAFAQGDCRACCF